MPDFATLENLRKNHPAWRLLCAQHAPLIISFLHRVFVAPNRRTIAQADIVEALEDELFSLREAGMDVPVDAITVEECADAIAKNFT